MKRQIERTLLLYGALLRHIEEYEERYEEEVRVVNKRNKWESSATKAERNRWVQILKEKVVTAEMGEAIARMDEYELDRYEDVLRETIERVGILKRSPELGAKLKALGEKRHNEEAYLKRTINYLVQGDFGDDFTGTGLVIQIAMGIVGVDLPMDIRDFVANIQKKDYGSAALCAIGFLPVIGVLKNVKQIEKIGGAIAKVTPEVIESFSDIAKHIEAVKGVGGEAIEMLDELKDSLRHHAKEIRDPGIAAEVGKLIEGIEESGDVFKRANEIREFAEILNDTACEVTKQGGRILSIVERIGRYDEIKNIVKATGGGSSGAEIVRNSLKEAGIKTPPYPNAVHHIVAGGAKQAKESVVILEKYGIEVNSAANGVFLPYSKNAYVTTEAMHSGGHSDAYYTYVESVLKRAEIEIHKKKLSLDEAREYICDILQDIRESLLKGDLKVHK